ncbi:hypothetical protein IQ266_17260 [filamentous cyanobacterium LEGE 11480]|uniref:Uncharacterized protein n=1 Tax=Romeriopsis navalis LEGE 11480 TaxID=2777977 RepID=A0A928VSM7_9CYAN|nr:hypothetical protein [Romeriopsis navalis]MBE9031484.1 hypothetical protein [Romeriopsis navalis LEGE 11480]
MSSLTDSDAAKCFPELGSAAPSYRYQSHLGSPGNYIAPARFLDVGNTEELVALAQIAETFLQDPIAAQWLCDRVIEIMHWDIELTQGRWGR